MRCPICDKDVSYLLDVDSFDCMEHGPFTEAFVKAFAGLPEDAVKAALKQHQEREFGRESR
jgi:hypothetical protein